MRLGYHLGYWSAGPPADAQATVLALEDLGYDSVWTAEAYGSDALTPLAWWGARTTDPHAGHEPRAALGPQPHRDGDGGDDPGPPQRWPVRPRAGRQRPAGRRGLVRRALPPAAGPDPGVRPGRAGGGRPRAPGHQRRRALPAALPGRHRAGQAVALDAAPACGPTCRSTSAPRGRRTSRSPRRSPTAGCRCSSRPRPTPSTARPSPRGSPAPAPVAAPRTSR